MFKLRIEQDTDAQSPADYGDDGLFLVSAHRDFFVPPSPKARNFDLQAEIDERKATHHCFLVEAYIHGGVHLSLANCGNYPDRQWDVSLCACVFAAKNEWKTKASARKAALSKVEEWNQYLSGDVWGCVVEDDNGTHLDSCWGFYGREYAESEGKQMLEYCQKNASAEACMI